MQIPISMQRAGNVGVFLPCMVEVQIVEASFLMKSLVTSNGREVRWIGSLLIDWMLELVPGRHVSEPRAGPLEPGAGIGAGTCWGPFPDTFLKDEVADLRHLPTKTSFRELQPHFHRPGFFL